MATTYKLTYRDERGGRWRKRYKCPDGVTRDFYFPRLPKESKEASHARCWAEWEKKKAEIDAGSTGGNDWSRSERGLTVLIERMKSQLAELAKDDTPQNRALWLSHRQLLITYEQWIARGTPVIGPNDDPENPPDFVPWQLYEEDPDPAVYDPPPWAVPGPPKSTDPNTVAACVKRFLGRKAAQAQRGERSSGRVEVLRVGLESFSKQVGGDEHISAVTSPALSQFRDGLEALIAAEKLRPHSARDRLQAVKQFVRFLWEEELIALPRILKSREFAIALPEQRIETFTDVEVERLLGASSPSTKLYLLLMLNCGMTQIDIAELTHEEVDWKKGRVIRKRSKTRKNGNGKNVPSVSYPLWPETFRLLKAQRSKHPTLALTNANGEPLKVEKIANGKALKKDNVRSAYCRVVAKLANAKTDRIEIGKPLKLLRKSAATKLGKHPDYSRFAQHFLGHAPTTVADRHYVSPNEEQFEAAVAWLGTQFLGAN